MRFVRSYILVESPENVNVLEAVDGQTATGIGTGTFAEFQLDDRSIPGKPEPAWSSVNWAALQRTAASMRYLNGLLCLVRLTIAANQVARRSDVSSGLLETYETRASGSVISTSLSLR